MVGRPISEMVIFPALYKGFWKAMYQMKARFLLYLMIHDYDAELFKLRKWGI